MKLVKRMARAGLLLALAWVAPSRAAEPEAGPAAAAQVLVMLQVPAPHFQPGASYSGAYRTANGSAARRRLAQSLAAAHGLELVSDWPMPVLGIECYVMALPTGSEAARVAALLEADKRVAWAQPVAAFRSLATGDPLYPAQPGASRWKLDALHRTATGRSVTVAVIDSGIDEQHPDLAGQVLHRQNFIDNSAYAGEPHGTAVAGIIAARADNGIGIRGVAPQARLLALRACRETSGQAGAQCDSFSLGKALNFAIMRDPKVINLSLTGPSDRLLQRLLDVALLRGIAVVGAADPALADGGFPASWPGVFSVGGDAAPGRDIPSTLPGARYGMVSGSSYASAHVSGLLALVDELRPRATPPQLQAYLRSSPAAPIDACAALTRASGDCVCSCPVPAIVQATRSP
jgi:subtilisin family serine protease